MRHVIALWIGLVVLAVFAFLLMVGGLVIQLAQQSFGFALILTVILVVMLAYLIGLAVQGESRW